MEGVRGKAIKNPHPFLNIEGTRVLRVSMFFTRPWCHPACLAVSLRKQDHFCWLCCCVGTIHPIYLSLRERKDFLRSAAHEGVLRVHFRSELPLFIGSLLGATLILCSLNAGQTLLLFCCTKHNRYRRGMSTKWNDLLFVFVKGILYL